MYQSAVPYARELGLEGMPLVAYNGAMVREFPSDKLIYHEPLPLDICKALTAFCEARGYHIQAYVNDQLFVPDMGPATQQYMQLSRVQAQPVGSLFLWLSEPSTKLLIQAEPERMPQVQAEVQDLLGQAVAAAPSYPMYLEVVNSKVNKGEALKAVAEAMGLTREEVMAVGDGMNDLTMLQWAGTSFAVGHAPEELRQAATYVTESGSGHAVAEALLRMGLA